ncbi:alpha/beta-hydrolase [Rhodotorula sp. JG-1b]|nr:alpha/beta-hydrolase [Rhodotorula sp. JG-1b]
MSLGQCCITGFKHDGTPSGKFETLNGVKTYIALPRGDYDNTKALLFLTDIFGTELPNGQLLVDSFAANGIPVYMPDIIKGDPVSLGDFSSGKFDLMGWLGKHGKEVTRPEIDKVIEHLKGQGVQKFAAIGYCFGGRYTVDLVVDGAASVGVVAHPSLLETPKDIEDLNKSSGHFLWLNAGEDGMFNKEKQNQAREILKGNDKHKMVDYEGVGHGFAIRGDPKDEHVRKAADDAFEQSVKFIKAHL